MENNIRIEGIISLEEYNKLIDFQEKFKEGNSQFVYWGHRNGVYNTENIITTSSAIKTIAFLNKELTKRNTELEDNLNTMKKVIKRMSWLEFFKEKYF